MNEQEAILLYVDDLSKDPNPRRVSCLTAIVRDARVACARDIHTGKRIESLKASWLGMVGYLIALDQVGTAVKRHSYSGQNAPIENALEQFTDLPEKERQLIYSLRNAMLHNYSLVNVHPKRRPGYNHVLTMTDPLHSTLATFPKTEWNGDFASVIPGVSTVVNINAVADVAELAFVRLSHEAHSANLRINVAGGVTELIKRFTFQIGGP